MTDLQTPQATDQLASVLREIAAIEATPGFEGPKITQAISHILDWKEDWDQDDIEAVTEEGRVDFRAEWIEDIIVGEIGRACLSLGLAIGVEHWQHAWFVEIGRIVENPVQRGIENRSLALAAAAAYRDALKAAVTPP